jgi:hypothetical protein
MKIVVKLVALQQLAEVTTHRNTTPRQPSYSHMRCQKTDQHKEVLVDIDHEAIALALERKGLQSRQGRSLEGVVKKVGEGV